NDAVLAEAETIDTLVELRGADLKAADDLPKREGEVASLHRQLDELARRLGLADRMEVLARRPDDAAVTRVRRLIAESRRLDDQQMDQSERIAKASETINALARRQAALGPVADPAPLRRKLEPLGGFAERIEARDVLVRSVR